MHNRLPVVELRQYTLHAGRRDELIELFESCLVEPQEDAGMHLLGQFHDLDDPDRFVWLRGFADMTARRDALTAFYLEGECGRDHRGAANATMARLRQCAVVDAGDRRFVPVRRTRATAGGRYTVLTSRAGATRACPR